MLHKQTETVKPRKQENQKTEKQGERTENRRECANERIFRPMKNKENIIRKAEKETKTIRASQKSCEMIFSHLLAAVLCFNFCFFFFLFALQLCC